MGSEMCIRDRGERQGETAPGALIDDLPLFSAQPSKTPEPKGPSEVELAILETNPDELSPRDALALIYELKSKSILGSS